jgi:hypothetical protein
MPFFLLGVPADGGIDRSSAEAAGPRLFRYQPAADARESRLTDAHQSRSA